MSLFPSSDPGFGAVKLGDAWYQPAMYHQLQCLDLIRRHYHPDAWVHDGPVHETSLYRIESCLDYLRQSVLCNGDTSLEQAQYSEEVGYTASGMNVVHSCWDWTQVHSYVQRENDQT